MVLERIAVHLPGDVLGQRVTEVVPRPGFVRLFGVTRWDQVLVDAHDVSGDAQLSDGLFGAWRDGGQAQYTEHVSPADAGHPLQPTIAWMEENAGASLDLQAIALHASVSVRTLNRQFREHFGTTPPGATRPDTDGPGTPAAGVHRAHCGSHRRTIRIRIVSVAALSLPSHFLRTVGVSPQKYRQSYTGGR